MLPRRFSLGTAVMLCSLALTSWAVSVATTQGREMTLLDVARVRHVTAVELSPDQRHLAVVVAVPRRPFVEEDGPAWQELHVVGPERQVRPYVTGSVRVNQVRWVPGRSQISFTAKRGDDAESALYVIPVDGGEARRVVEHPAGVGVYAWSPDGERVAFLATEEVPKQRQKEAEKGFKAEVVEEDWRPMRVWLGHPEVERDPWAEEKPAEAEPLELPGSAHALEWSPNGQWLAVALAPTPSVDDALMRQRIHIVDAATHTVCRVVQTPGKLGGFRWSPDSERLVLVATTDWHDPREGRLLVVERAGGGPRELGADYPGHYTQAEWLNAGSLLVLGQVGVGSEMRVVELEGGVRTVFKSEDQIIDGLTVRPGGDRVGLVVESAHHPAEAFAMPLEAPTPERWTVMNPWLREVQLARQEVVRYAARDGLQLEGILVRPLGEEAGRRYPLILAVHGGPESHQANGWVTSYSRLGQAAAAKGFAVFYPNYRGSTGRGVAFSKLGQGDYAGSEFNDLVDAVEHLVSAGWVDRGRVGITGGSYGGYATAWCSTALTEHFAAGVMFVGISDLVSKFGTTDIPDEMTAVHARRYPWDDWGWFLERSPIRHAEQSRTPLLIMHGKADPRVHPSQSLELYRYLKERGQAPVRLVWYPGEGHGNRNAASRLDYSRRAMRWFVHYLQGARGEPPPYQLEYEDYGAEIAEAE